MDNRIIISSLVFFLLSSCSKKENQSRISDIEIQKIYYSVVYSEYIVNSVSSFITELLSMGGECISDKENEKIFNCSSTSPAIFGLIRKNENRYSLNITVSAENNDEKINAELSGTTDFKGEGMMINELSIALIKLSGSIEKRGKINLERIVFSKLKNGFATSCEEGKIKIDWTESLNLSLKNFRYTQYSDPNTSYINITLHGDISSEGSPCIGNFSENLVASVIGVIGENNIVCPVEGEIKTPYSRFNAKEFSCNTLNMCMINIF